MLGPVWQPETAVKQLARDYSKVPYLTLGLAANTPCVRLAVVCYVRCAAKPYFAGIRGHRKTAFILNIRLPLSTWFRCVNDNPLLHAALFGMISRSSSRGGDVRPTGASDPAAGRAGSTIILPSPRELELVRSHNSQLVPGETPALAYVPSPLGSMGGLAQAVINRVRGVRAGQESPRGETGRRSMSLLSRSGFRRDSCPTTPLAGVGSLQDPSSTFGTSLLGHLPASL